MSVVVDQIAAYMPVILILKGHGISTRKIAKHIGIPNSTLARYMPFVEQVGAEAFPELVSHLGQMKIKGPQETKLLTYQPVPCGTDDDRHAGGDDAGAMEK